MRFGSVCSGIEAAAVAWHPLGWRAAWCAEIEPFPSSVLAHHYPTVPNLGDMTTLPALVRLGLIDAPDVLVGGTPCQAFSVAGLRNSLDDDRGNLTLSYFHLLDEIDHARAERNEPACIAVWENVPGVLSTKDNAFGCFLAGLAGESDALEPTGGRWSDAGCIVGPERTVAWRILDAQYFGLAQRRRRVFVVASARDDVDPVAILFEFDGVRRDTPPSRETRQETTGTLEARTSGGGFPGTDGACSGHVVPALTTFDRQSSRGYGTAPIASTDGARDNKSASDPILLPETMPTLRAGSPNGGAGAVARSGDSKDEYIVAIRTAQTGSNGCGITPGRSAYTLDGAQGQAVACDLYNAAIDGENSHTLRDGNLWGVPGVLASMQVRRLTPRECERLQGFPDDYTLVPHRNKPAADGPRYKALGNSMAVPCMAWIGKRIAEALP